MEGTGDRGKVLVVDDDADIAELVHALLSDEGFAVSVLTDVSAATLRVAVGRLEPDCVLLDGQSVLGFGTSWDDAAWLHTRDRTVPTIMFTAHPGAIQEAIEGTSEQARAAGFAGVLLKPFNLDELVALVTQCVGQAEPFDPSPEAETHRTARLVERLQAAGARDIHASTRREWANFRTPRGVFIQLYWWQRDGVYYVVRHPESGGRLEPVGRFHDLDAAIALAMQAAPED